MIGPRQFRRWSLTAQLVTSYLLVLGIGGLVTILAGSYIVSTTMMSQERRTARHDLVAARAFYERQFESLSHAVRFAAASEALLDRLTARQPRALSEYLASIQTSGDFDFVGVTDSAGRLLANSLGPAGEVTVDLAGVAPIADAPARGAYVGTEILPFAILGVHGTALEQHARIHATPDPTHGATPVTLDGGMVQLAAAPVRNGAGRVIAVLYAGTLLGGRDEIVDRVNQAVYGGERYYGQLIGSVTIFQGNVRIATTVPAAAGGRAIGTVASAEVSRRVLQEGRTWNDRAYVVSDWYVSAYEPIRNARHQVIGMLYVGMLQSVFTQTRDRVILLFLVIAGMGFLAIIFTTYYMIRRVTKPLVDMAAVARRITTGRFDQEVFTDLPGELGVLGESFNAMQFSLREMHADLEDWASTLEDKVAQRTEELVRMQARVAQSEHLASLGMLSAGVAHEINNPLGGILALTSLTLEDIPSENPCRENLEEVVRQAERCRNIVKGLLEFSRQSETHREPVDINDVLARTLNLIESQALFFNVDVVREWQLDLPAVEGDRSELQQVFMNLIVNAVQSMAEKGTIRIRTRYDQAADQVEVRVSDTGHGIPRELIARIFDPFFTTKASGQGPGLGLSIAYGIVTKHGGTIAVESEPGVGTSFTIRFPATDAAAPEAAH
ncbi:MAG: HAMP domain-containing protein [Gemmatimonadetes bacterium]|nr:HAMP domain-containing protein [Gemmatimonadota bacterium]